MWFHQKNLNKFFIQTNISVLKNNILLKNYFHLKMKIIMLKAFISRIILYFYQNARWNQRKIAPKIYPKKKHIFLPKMAPL
jgi:hypothetical protein